MRNLYLLLIGLFCCSSLIWGRTVVEVGEQVIVEGQMQGEYLLNGGELIFRDQPADLAKIELHSGILQVDHGFSRPSSDSTQEFPLRINAGLTIILGLWDLTDWGLDTVAIIQGGSLQMLYCTIAAEQVGVFCEETPDPILITHCYFGRSQQSSIQLWDGDLQIDSSRFVTNNVAIQVRNDAQVSVLDCQFIECSQAIATYDDAALVEVWDCDFLGNTLHDVNCYNGEGVLTGCYRDEAADLVGNVVVVDPAPGQLLDDPPDPKATTPDAVGPDQLEWVEVTKTIQDQPIRVTGYKIYRGADPYAVFAPENYLTTTTNTWFNDPGHGGLADAFYVVVSVSGP